MGFSHIAADLRGKWGNEKKESLAPLIPNLAALVTPFLQKGGGGGRRRPSYIQLHACQDKQVPT